MTSKSCYDPYDEYENIDVAMKQCSNDSKCLGVEDSACDGKKFELCDEDADDTIKKNCFYEKLRNYHF